MPHIQSLSVSDGQLPVFVFPTSLLFYSDDRSTHKQVLTVYNPYDFAVRFKVLATAPHKYAVIDSDGTIKPKCGVDVVVRHKDICANNEGVRDKFKLQLTEVAQNKVLGHREVVSVLHKTNDTAQLSSDKYETLPSSTNKPTHCQEQPSTRQAQDSSPSMVVVLAALACIVGLFLPTAGDLESSLPTYLHLSLPQKLVAAYVLGMVTMVLLRS